MSSWKAEVQTNSTGSWTGNDLLFETEEEAKAYVEDLSYRWTSVINTRVVMTGGDPNYKFEDGKSIPIPGKYVPSQGGDSQANIAPLPREPGTELQGEGLEGSESQPQGEPPQGGA